MPKVCEICKQPYADNLTSCPNCDIVDIFGSTTPTSPPPPLEEDPDTVDLGGDPALRPATDPGMPKPKSSGARQPTTKVQGPIPPVGANVGPPSAIAPKVPTAQAPAQPGASPLMARAMEGTKSGQPAGQKGDAKATQLPSSGAPQPTMVAPQSSTPTMVAPQSGKPTVVAPQSGKPTQVAPQSGKPTMVAKGAAPPTMIAPRDAEQTLDEIALPPAGAKGAAPAALPKGTPPGAPGSVLAKGTPPAAAAAAGKEGAKATMIPRGAAQPTMVAKGSKPPTMLMPPNEPLLDMPAEGGAPPAPGGAKKTMVPQGAKQATHLAKTGQKTQLAPPGEAPLDVPGAAAAADPKKTMLPKGAATPTMLVKGGAPTTLAPEGTQPLETPGGTKKTMMAKGGKPTTLAPEDTQPLAPPGQTGMALGQPQKPTMMAKTAPPTYLAPEGSEPLALPEGAASPKKTMLPKPPAPTTLAPEGTDPMDLPPGAAVSSPLKKTQLPQGVRQPTILAPPEEATAMDYPEGGVPPKRTQLPQGARQPTILTPPEEATALEIPGQDIAATVEQAAPSLAPSESGEMAREMLEGGRSTVDLNKLAGEPGLDSASKYDTAAVAAPPVKPHYKRRWLGGIILGLMLASATLVGLWFFKDQEPVLGWLKAAGLRPDTLDSKRPLEDALARLDNGDFEDVFRTIPEDQFNDKPDYDALRGVARWLRYFQDAKVNNKPLEKDASEVTRSRNELTEAKKKGIENARIKFFPDYFLGHMAEQLTPEEASKVYADGGRANSSEKTYFDASMIRVDVMSRIAPPAPPKTKGDTAIPKDDGKEKKDGGQSRRHLTEQEALEVLALILTAQQGAPGQAAQPEAGSKFWEAYRAAQRNDYPAAVKALKEARDIHDKQRFVRLRKPQNPFSDPTEEIFLRAADDLNMYWQVREKLLSSGYDLAKMTPLEAIDRMRLAATKPDEALMRIAKALGVEPKVDEILKTIDGLGDDKKIAADVKKALVDGKYVNEEQKDLIKGTQNLIEDAKTKQKIAERVAKAGVKEEDTDKGVGLIIEKRDDLQDTFNKVGDKLAKAKYIEPKPNKEELLKGVDLAIEAALSPLVAALGRALSGMAGIGSQAPLAGAPLAELAAQLALAKLEIEALRAREKTVRTPREMLEFWLPALKNPELKEVKDVADQASVDAKRVLDDKIADASGKAAAQSVQGLVNRINGDFDGARASLGDALKTGRAVKEGFWRKYAANALKDLSDPTAYYLPRGEELGSIGHYDQALDVLNSGVGAFPKDGRVLALRSQVRLELARAQARGPLTLKNPTVDEARKDAEAAIAAGSAADGSYALGRVYEDVGDPVTAEKQYRRALAANPAGDRAGSRYRVALGRVLLKLNPLPGQPLPAAPAPAGNGAPDIRKVGQLLPQNIMDLPTTLALVLTGFVADDDETPDLDEIIRLADQAIRNKNYEGYLIKARALARKGMWTEALKTYDLGLRYLIRPEYSEGLSEIVNNHPAFNLPDPLRNPDPLRAERHYGAGLRLYYAGQYQQAEREFLEAYRNQGQDARILYYLGLSRLPQNGKRQAAIVNFQMGSILEQQSKPSPTAVNASLERVQGELRRYMNGYRP